MGTACKRQEYPRNTTEITTKQQRIKFAREERQRSVEEEPPSDMVNSARSTRAKVSKQEHFLITKRKVHLHGTGALSSQLSPPLSLNEKATQPTSLNTTTPCRPLTSTKQKQEKYRTSRVCPNERNDSRFPPFPPSGRKEQH